MKTTKEKFKILIKYNEDKESKDRFIRFLVDYFLNKSINERAEFDETSKQ